MCQARCGKCSMEFDGLRRIICQVLMVDENEVSLDTSFVEDLDCDSIELFEIVMGVEEELDVKVEPSAMSGIKTVRDAMNLIKSTLGS